MTDRLRLLAPIIMLIALSCHPHDALIEGYSDLKEDVYPTQSAIIAHQGPIKLSRNNIYYVNSAGRLLRNDEILALPEGARRLILKKVLLRQLAVHAGRSESLYNDAEALEYILPRMEKILENYYYYKKSNFTRIESEVQKLAPDERALQELLDHDSRLKGRALSVSDLKREKDRLLRRLVRRRQNRAREESIARLLNKYPPAEIVP